MNTASKPLPISVIILTFNEEENIERCLKTVSDAFDQVFVVDSYSTDRTKEMVLLYLSPESFVEHPFRGYSEQRNWSQANLPLRNEWVLHLDADESLTEELVEELTSVFSREPAEDGFMVPMRTIFMGRFLRHGFVNPVYHNRLYKRTKGRCDSQKWNNHFVIDGRVGRLKGRISNFVSPNIQTWVERHLKEAKLDAEEILFGMGYEGLDGSAAIQPKLLGTPIERRRWLKYKAYYSIPKFLRPLIFFFFRYVLCGGFVDGREGLIYHVMHAWCRFLTDAMVFESEKFGTDDSRSSVKRTVS